VIFANMNLAQFIPTLAAAVAVIAAVTDVRERRIPNRLTYPAMVAGLVLQTAVYGWHGLLLGLFGALLFGGCFLLFHLVRAMGAGDVKLAVALGCIIGPAGSWQVMFHGRYRPGAADATQHTVRRWIPRAARAAHSSCCQPR
jgi:Flp pilus assembly protein protease CpaA